MPLTHDIDGHILTIHQHRVTDPTGILRGMESALADSRLQQGSHLIWNAVEAPARASPDKMQHLLAGLRQVGDRLSNRCAIVVANELQYGVSRMLSVYAEDVGLQVEVFYDLQAATDWLLQDGQPPGTFQNAMSTDST